MYYEVNTIYILDRNKNVIGNISGNSDTPFFDDIFDMDLTTGMETYSFSVLNNIKYENKLIGGNYIAFKYKGKYKLFTIVTIEDEHEEDAIIKSIYAEGVSFSLINNIVRKQSITGNIKTFLNTVLAETDFIVGNVDNTVLNNVITVEIDTVTTVLECIQSNLSEFGCELEFIVEINNNKLTSQKINVYKERGTKTNIRFEYGNNMLSINRKVDWTDFCTALVPYGEDDVDIKSAEWSVAKGNPIDKPLNQDYIADMDAFSLYNRGRHIYGVFEGKSNNAYDLLNEAYKELKNRSKPKMDYEVSTVNIDEIDLGDTVNIVDFKFIPALLLEARVSRLEISFSDKTQNKATFSNYKETISKIKSLKKADIMNEVLDYLSQLQAGILSETDIKMLKEYMEKMNIEKEEIDNLFNKYLPVINTTTIKGSNISILLETNRTYKCEVLEELALNIDDTDNVDFTSVVEFQTGFDCYPMKFKQPNEIYMTGSDTINGALLNKADTSYKITISYDNNQTVPRKFKGVVEVINRGNGKYKVYEGFSNREEMLELAKQYYDNRSLFKYNQLTPLTYYKQGLDPALYIDNWKTDNLYHIDCSTFTNQLFRARGYLNSIYKDLSYGMGASKKYGWGFDIGRTAAEQAKFCIDNGYHLDISTTDESDWWNLLPSDLVFWQTRSGDGENASDRFMGVSHVAIVRNPKTTSGTTTTYEVSTVGEIVLNRSLQNNYPEKILFFARVRR